ncbi:MAG: hypothetical protein JWP97_6224 [Labilithrix sp.]|nr:hypothetical protein [Labilithrix sp.]
MLSRLMALTTAASLVLGSVGCGKSDPPAPVDDTRTGATQVNNGAVQPQAKGMSTGTKVVLLAGAAATYYLYKKHQNAAAATGPDGQYYLSKNGRVYYRDADHRAHWVTPPAEGISVPESEASAYSQFQGFNGRSEGRDLAGLGSDSND